MTITPLRYAVSTATIPLPVSAEGVDALEAVDANIKNDNETVDVGPFGTTYLRLTGTDLVAFADALRLLSDRIIDTVMEARQERVDAERHRCECGALLDADEDDCGAARCRFRRGAVMDDLCTCGHERYEHDQGEGREGCQIVVSMRRDHERCPCDTFTVVR